ncbi:hypothetical protein YPPY54_4340, partial [Yersinia pestis PY-54]
MEWERSHFVLKIT